MNIFPVILAGGSGTRLWPLSRENFPKQFLRLQNGLSPLEQTLERVSLLPMEKLFLVTNENYYFHCQEQIPSYISSLQYILEPCSRNTAPAISITAHFLYKYYSSDAIMIILPSDHWIGDNNKWQKAILEGTHYVKEHDEILCFGIKPDSPKTGYGYIEALPQSPATAYKILRFCEKPDISTAEAFVNSKRFWWNSGMFICRAGRYLAEIQQFAPEIYQQTATTLRKSKQQHDFLKLDLESFSACYNESIDYAVMEKTTRAALIPLEVPWNDLGCWLSVAESNQTDAQGNVLQGSVITQESNNCYISADGVLVSTLGIHNQIVVATKDAVLVADKSYSQAVKDLVQTLKKNHPQLVTEHQRISRPWGYFEVLAESPCFKVKHLMVKPGARLSLQKHQFRSEHWVIVSGVAEVINQDLKLNLKVNESTYIPPHAVHRLSNPGPEPLFVVEVQTGSYLGEDDIERFEDLYLRECLGV